MKKPILALALNLVIISACANQFIYCPVAMNCAGDTCTVSDNVSGFWPNSIPNIYNLSGNYPLFDAQAAITNTNPVTFNLGCTYMQFQSAYPLTIGIYVMSTNKYGPTFKWDWHQVESTGNKFDCNVIYNGAKSKDCPFSPWSSVQTQLYLQDGMSHDNF